MQAMLPGSTTRKTAIIKALAHPSRVTILEALEGGERCVCELQELVGSDLSTVSRHLSVLRNAGLVCDRKQGLWVYYSLRTPCILEFLRCLDSIMEQPCACGQGGEET